jgi:hypothetical protein
MLLHSWGCMWCRPFRDVPTFYPGYFMLQMQFLNKKKVLQIIVQNLCIPFIIHVVFLPKVLFVLWFKTQFIDDRMSHMIQMQWFDHVIQMRWLDHMIQMRWLDHMIRMHWLDHMIRRYWLESRQSRESVLSIPRCAYWWSRSLTSEMKMYNWFHHLPCFMECCRSFQQ